MRLYCSYTYVILLILLILLMLLILLIRDAFDYFDTFDTWYYVILASILLRYVRGAAVRDAVQPAVRVSQELDEAANRLGREGLRRQGQVQAPRFRLGKGLFTQSDRWMDLWYDMTQNLGSILFFVSYNMRCHTTQFSLISVGLCKYPIKLCLYNFCTYFSIFHLFLHPFSPYFPQNRKIVSTKIGWAPSKFEYRFKSLYLFERPTVTSICVT
jgi:hypothetical protein